MNLRMGEFQTIGSCGLLKREGKKKREKKKGNVIAVLAKIPVHGGMAVVGGLPIGQSELVICL